MKRIAFFIIALSLPVFAQVRTFSLEESLQLGLGSSKDIKIAEAKMLSSDAKVSEYSSQMLPKLSLSGGYTRLSDIPPFQISLPIFPQPVVVSETILNIYSVKASLQQPLFTGFRLSSLRKSAKYNYQASQLEYSKETNEAAFRIMNSYWDFYKAKRLRGLLEENLNQLGKRLEDARNFLKNGLLAQNDVLKLEVQYSEVKLQLIDAENAVKITQGLFNQALGLNLQDSTDVEMRDIQVNESANDLNQFIKEARENRNELKSLAYQAKASEAGITAARSGWFPSIYLTGNFYYSRPNTRIQPAKDEFKDTWDVGISANWELWNWGYTSSLTEQAAQGKVQIDANLSKLQDAIEAEVYRNYLSLEKSIQKVKVSELSVQQASENHRIVNEKFNYQLASSADLIDAETADLQAKTNLTNALIDYELSKARLEKSLGRKIY
jgi:outer membrane protein TolC